MNETADSKKPARAARRAAPKPVELSAAECADRLVRARLAAGYATQTAAAEACGMKVSVYSRHERGERIPLWSTLHRMATGMGLDPKILFPDLFNGKGR